MDGLIAHNFFSEDRNKAWEEYLKLPEIKSLVEGMPNWEKSIYKIGFEAGYFARYEQEQKRNG